LRDLEWRRGEVVVRPWLDLSIGLKPVRPRWFA
jgi:hypothetical protein